jgi:hypothetical protein
VGDLLNEHAMEGSVQDIRSKRSTMNRKKATRMWF